VTLPRGANLNLNYSLHNVSMIFILISELLTYVFFNHMGNRSTEAEVVKEKTRERHNGHRITEDIMS
jgi:hypothetical protein